MRLRLFSQRRDEYRLAPEFAARLHRHRIEKIDRIACTTAFEVGGSQREIDRHIFRTLSGTLFEMLYRSISVARRNLCPAEQRKVHEIIRIERVAGSECLQRFFGLIEPKLSFGEQAAGSITSRVSADCSQQVQFSLPQVFLREVDSA